MRHSTQKVLKSIVILSAVLTPVLASQAYAEQVTMIARFSYTSVEPNDGKYDDLYGNLAINGQNIWSQSSSRHTSLYKGQTVNLGSYTVRVDSTRLPTVLFQANLMDYDKTSRDDTIGNWNLPLNFNQAYLYMRKYNFNTTRYTFPVHGDDDAYGVMNIDFERR